ncbi:MAG: acylneuraminate cytidylyltransferase family protein [Pseudomonadota bacterium]
MPMSYERKSSPDVVAFVHAKGQSTRVPGKNMRKLGDAPMFCHAIRNALACELIDLVVIDSENDEILELGKRYGAKPLRRPPELASNATTGDDLMYWQASNYKDSRLVMQAVPTAPFIRPDTYAAAIQAIDEHDVDSVCACGKEAFYPWVDGRPAYFRADGTIPNSFELAPLIFETTGLYVTKTAHALAHKKRMNVESCYPLVVSKIEVLDINTAEDFDLAETVWHGLNRLDARIRYV